jgi:GH24 family phage-related lysozyme (muramidase)
MSAGLGRFMSPDPGNAGADFTNPQSWNGYAYVLGNPLGNTDPSGDDTCSDGSFASVCVTDSGPGPLGTWNYSASSGLWGPDQSSGGTYTFFVSTTAKGPVTTSSTPSAVQLSVPTVNQCNVSAAAMMFVASCEGYRGRAYNDSRGNCTIGYGHLLHYGNCAAGDGSLSLSSAAALNLFAEDAQSTVSALNNALQAPVTQQQFDALFSLAYNMGGRGPQRHDVWQDVNGGNLAAAPGAITPLRGGGPGIPARRANEANMFENGVYANSCYSHR